MVQSSIISSLKQSQQHRLEHRYLPAVFTNYYKTKIPNYILKKYNSRQKKRKEEKPAYCDYYER